MINTGSVENDTSSLGYPPNTYMNIDENDRHKELIPAPAVTEQCPWCDNPISHSRFAEIEAKIRNQEEMKLAEAGQQLRAAMEVQHAAELSHQRQLNEQQAEKTVQAKLTVLDAERQKLFSDQLSASAKDRDESILKAQSDFNRERESLQLKIKEMERVIQKKTSQDLGESSEIDLYTLLREAFPGDRVTRVAKGQPGADIHLEVLHKGMACGLIIVESKNTKTWQTSFVAKLRQDQLAAGADHAILATTVFPRGQKDLCVESNVILVNPSQVAHIVALLRRSVLTIHLRGLGQHERASKMSMLYALITSDKYIQQFRELEKLSGDIVTLDASEKKSHETVWKKRGALTTRIASALSDIASDVADVIEGQEPTELSIAS